MVKFKCQNQNDKINSNVKGQISKHGFYHLSFKFSHYFVISALSFVILMSGCVSFKEAWKGFNGVSTKILEEQRPNAIKKTFAYNYNTCYNKVRAILVKSDAYIYAKDPKSDLIAVYVSEEDTTPVGVFFKEIGPESTQVEVSSPSTYAKEHMAKIIFDALDLEIKAQ